LLYENLNVILVIVGLCTSIAIPFILRAFSKRDTAMEKMEEENDKIHDNITQRLDKYEERLRLAEMELVRHGYCNEK